MAEISAKLLISKADQSFQTFIRAKVKYSIMSQSETAADPQETESLQNIYSILCWVLRQQCHCCPDISSQVHSCPCLVWFNQFCLFIGRFCKILNASKQQLDTIILYAGIKVSRLFLLISEQALNQISSP